MRLRPITPGQKANRLCPIKVVGEPALGRGGERLLGHAAVIRFAVGAVSYSSRVAKPVTDQLIDIIRELAEENETFTSDELRPLLPAGATVRQIPAAFGKARRDGLIVEVGRVKSTVPERKGSQVAVFRGAHKPPLPSVDAAVDQPSVSAPSSDDVEAEIDALRVYLEERGYLVGQEEIASLLLMLATRTWLVLAGPTGTGKSRIVRLLADAFDGVMDDLQVRPNWTSSDDVLGYYSEVSSTFLPGPLYRALDEAAQQPSSPRFVRFDEMNLASPEYYLAEVLSAAEDWGLSDKGSPVSAEVNLPPMPADAAPEPVRLSNAVFLVGTLNMDETAKVLSPKVLDRAAVYDLHHIDLYSLPSATAGEVKPPQLPLLKSMLLGKAHSLVEAQGHLDDDAVQVVGDLLSGLEPHLRVLGAPPGYRQRDALLFTIAAWRKNGLGSVLPFDAMLDVALRATVIPKLQGASVGAIESLRRLLGALIDVEDLPSNATPDQLRQLMPKSRFPRTLDRILDMLDQAETLGYFSAW